MDQCTGEHLRQVTNQCVDAWQKKDSGMWELEEEQHYTMSKIGIKGERKWGGRGEGGERKRGGKRGGRKGVEKQGINGNLSGCWLALDRAAKLSKAGHMLVHKTMVRTVSSSSFRRPLFSSSFL